MLEDSDRQSYLNEAVYLTDIYLVTFLKRNNITFSRLRWLHTLHVWSTCLPLGNLKRIMNLVCKYFTATDLYFNFKQLFLHHIYCFWSSFFFKKKAFLLFDGRNFSINFKYEFQWHWRVTMNVLLSCKKGVFWNFHPIEATPTFKYQMFWTNVEIFTKYKR